MNFNFTAADRELDSGVGLDGMGLLVVEDVAKAELRTLYVQRRLLNGGALREWARTQGLESALPAGDMHVTVAFSRAEVDWSRLEPDKDAIVVMGPRSVHQFPPQSTQNGALVLRISADELNERWRYYKDRGASWDHDGYTPHVTITYSVANASGVSIEPYRGPLILGPEILSDVNEGWAGEVSEEPLAKAFDPNQPRDDEGKWTATISGGGPDMAGGGSSASFVGARQDSKAWRTAKEAEAGIRKDVGIAMYYEQGFSDDVTEKQFIEKARVVHDVGSDLAERFPGLRNPEGTYLTSDSPLPVFQVELAKGRFVPDREADGKTLASWMQERNRLVLASSLPDREGKLKRGGWTVAGDNMRSTLRHELGHATQRYFDRQVKDNDGFGLLSASDAGPGLRPDLRYHISVASALFRSQDRAMIMKSLSKYAATNSKEYFAESFAAYTHPDYGTERSSLRIHPKLEQLFDKVYRKV